MSFPSQSRILIVEDEHDVRELISLHLSRDGFRADEAVDGLEGLAKLKVAQYDLFVLDWMLPKLTGMELIRTIRQTPQTASTPILMVTARVEPADIVLGLETGADDYITKPFDIPVLMARVRALLRRTSPNTLATDSSAIDSRRISFSGLLVDLDAHEASCNGTPLSLTRSEFNLLVTLLQNQGKVLTREKLIDEIRGEDISIVQRAIDTHIFGLRKKLGPCADIVETIRGVGYRIRSQ